ncbi:hypothetical protein EGT49_04005 [Companilactobacillus suantsaicola]|uniref:Uncharacterized protein n=2 Tax=Companilactobacillus suantsaicola TaxID=2487723 RepID=A0A4Z0JPH7_9LACO|nr:hypothetical protein EGT49_04005 [Companilactobacillus suantsaicola]
MRKSTNFKKFLICIIMFSFFAGRLVLKKNKEIEAAEIATEVIDNRDEVNIVPKHEPTGDVKKFLGMWMTSGYSLQPEEHVYTIEGNPVTLYTDAGRALVTKILTFTSWQHYQWYESSDGRTWSKVSDKNGGSNRNLTVTPKQVGVKYYQLRTAWYMLLGPSFLDPQVWTKVATVHALDSDVDIQDLSVTTDDDYIYNLENEITTTSTYARAKISPADFTGTVKWSIDKPEIATIDEDTGLITANNRAITGEVKVTATAINSSDGSTKEASTTVMVGGGLDDQTVYAGESATFKLLGNIGEFEEQEDLVYSIRWFKEDPINHEQSEIEIGNNSVSHTTPVTTLDDDGTEIFAHIEVKSGGKKYEYDTNKAKLTVLSKDGPEIDIEDTLTNQTVSDRNDSPTMLFDVIGDDNVVYNTEIANKSTGSRLKNATYYLPIRKGSKVNEVLVDGTAVDFKINTDSKSEDVVEISDLNFGINQSHAIEVSTTISDVNKRETYRSTGYVHGVDDNGSAYQKFGDTRTINLITNKLEYSVNDIDYGNIKPIANEKLIYRQAETNWPNNILEIDDMRRNKTALKLFLSQEAPLKDDQENELQGHLKYINDDSELDLLGNTALVSETAGGQMMNSLSWRTDKGVLLEMNNKLNKSGTYHAKLDWTFVDSVE